MANYLTTNIEMINADGSNVDFEGLKLMTNDYLRQVARKVGITTGVAKKTKADLLVLISQKCRTQAPSQPVAAVGHAPSQDLNIKDLKITQTFNVESGVGTLVTLELSSGAASISSQVRVGTTVREIMEARGIELNIPPTIKTAMVDGRQVDLDYVIKAQDKSVDYTQKTGRNG